MYFKILLVSLWFLQCHKTSSVSHYMLFTLRCPHFNESSLDLAMAQRNCVAADCKTTTGMGYSGGFSEYSGNMFNIKFNSGHRYPLFHRLRPNSS